MSLSFFIYIYALVAVAAVNIKPFFSSFIFFLQMFFFFILLIVIPVVMIVTLDPKPTHRNLETLTKSLRIF